MDDFANRDTRVLVCTDAAGMGVDVRDVARSIQWQIAEHLTFAALLQRVGRAGQDKDLPAVSIVFVEKKHMIRNVSGSRFLKYTTAIGLQDEERAKEIIARLYENNHQIRREKTQTPYHKVELTLLWFLNTVGCRRCLALACFMSDKFFQGHTQLACCDNCMYKQREDRGNTAVPAFERHGITAQHCCRYSTITEYQQTADSQANTTIPRQSGSKTSTIQQDACIEALDHFAATIWPRDMSDLIFSDALRQNLAASAAQISSVENLRDLLRPTCVLELSNLKIHAVTIVGVIQSAISSVPGESEQDLPDFDMQDIHNVDGRQHHQPEYNDNKVLICQPAQDKDGVQLRQPAGENAQRQEFAQRPPTPRRRGRPRGKAQPGRRGRQRGSTGAHVGASSQNPGRYVEGGKLMDWRVSTAGGRAPGVFVEGGQLMEWDINP